MITRAILCALALLVASPVVAQKSKSRTRGSANKADTLRTKGYRLAARHRYKKSAFNLLICTVDVRPQRPSRHSEL